MENKRVIFVAKFRIVWVGVIFHDPWRACRRQENPTVFLGSNQGCLSGWLLGSNLIVLQGATSGENDFGEQRFGLQKNA